MTKTDDSLFLPNPESIQTMNDVRDWMKRVSSMLSSNQQNVKSDLDNRMDGSSDQTVKGVKTFNSLKLGGSLNCNQKQLVSMVIENIF